MCSFPSLFASLFAVEFCVRCYACRAAGLADVEVLAFLESLCLHWKRIPAGRPNQSLMFGIKKVLRLYIPEISNIVRLEGKQLAEVLTTFSATKHFYAATTRFVESPLFRQWQAVGSIDLQGPPFDPHRDLNEIYLRKLRALKIPTRQPFLCALVVVHTYNHLYLCLRTRKNSISADGSVMPRRRLPASSSLYSPLVLGRTYP